MEYTLLELDFIDFKVVELMFEKSVLYKHKRLKFEKKKKKNLLLKINKSYSGSKKKKKKRTE